MTSFDVAALIVLGLSGLLALARGFIREALSIAALLAGAIGALYGYPVFRGVAREQLEPLWFADVVTVGGIFLAIYIAVTVFTAQLHKAAHSSAPIGMLDRAAGLGFGIVRGLVVLALGVMVLRAATPPDRLPTWLTEARLYPVIGISADMIAAVGPRGPTKAQEHFDVAPQSGPNPPTPLSDPPADATSDQPAEETEAGYTERDRERLDRLLNSAGGTP